MSGPRRVQLRRTRGLAAAGGDGRGGSSDSVGQPVCGRLRGLVATGEVRGEVGHYEPGSGQWFELAVPGGLTAAQAVDLYRRELVDALAEHSPGGDELRAALGELRGRDLACWCPLGAPCHADVLLELASREVAS